jgi:predicted membrane-bound spermidine synthase
MTDKRIPVLYALFALSGFCGLIYESIWSHYLKLFVGHAAYAQSLVLAVFMGGMGLGAWLTARFTHRIRNLLWGYALVELVIGLSALAFHGNFIRVTDWAYASLLPGACSPEGLCIAQWVLAGLLILPQSMLLGTTFPLMTGGVLRLAPDMPGARLAMLYFLNSIGAVFGVLASGFVLIPLVGLPGTMMAAGIGNLFLAVCVYFVGKPRAADAAAVPSAGAAGVGATRAPLLGTLLVVSLLTGLSSFIYEVAWIRMLSMVLGSATHSFEIMLASFILGLALGGLAIRRRIDRLREILLALAAVQMAMGVFALLTLPLYNHLFDAMAWLMSGLARSEAGYVLYTVSLKAVALAVMLPATFCAGMTLPLITTQLYKGGSGERAIGQVYAANTVGAILGVLLTVHLLMPQIGLKNAMVVAAAIDIVLGLILLLPRWRSTARPGIGMRVGAAGSAAFVLAAGFVFSFDPLRMGSSVFRGRKASLDADIKIPFAVDGKTATVHVAQHPHGTWSLATNGKVDGAIQMKPGGVPSADEVTMTVLGALPYAYKPRAAEVASIGFGTGMTSSTLLGSPYLKRLDTIEIEAAMVEGARLFRPVNEAAYTDARHRIVIDDAKAFFARGGRRYDVIVSEPSNPWVSGVSSLFTEEFYRRMRGHLNDDGLLVQWIQLYEITPELLASVYRALASSFPHYDVWLGARADMIIVAGRSALPAPRLGAMLGMSGLRAALERVGLASEARLAVQHLGDERLFGPLVASHAGGTNSDYFPLVDLYGPKARFLGASAREWTSLDTTDAPLVRLLGTAAPPRWTGPPSPISDLASRQQPWLRAQQLATFVRHGTLPAPQHDRIGDRDMALVLRQRLFVCAGAGWADSPWDGVVRFAGDTIPFLPPEDAVELWRAVSASPCAASFDAGQQRWVELFVALSEQRWPDVERLAAALLGDPAQGSGPRLLYLRQALALAHLAAGRADEAARQLAGQPPDTWARITGVLARASRPPGNAAP